MTENAIETKQLTYSYGKKKNVVRDLIEKLGEKCANIFKAILSGGSNYKEIAEEYGFASEGVVKIIKSRCKDKLVKLLGGFDNG